MIDFKDFHKKSLIIHWLLVISKHAYWCWGGYIVVASTKKLWGRSMENRKILSTDKFQLGISLPRVKTRRLEMLGRTNGVCSNTSPAHGTELMSTSRYCKILSNIRECILVIVQCNCFKRWQCSSYTIYSDLASMNRIYVTQSMGNIQILLACMWYWWIFSWLLFRTYGEPP